MLVLVSYGGLGGVSTCPKPLPAHL